MDNIKIMQSITLTLPKWGIEEITGYKPQTTFWDDFSIADQFGIKAVKDTFERVFAEWKGNHIYLTELVMVLNWKIWYWYSDGANHRRNEKLSEAYNDLWMMADYYAQQTLKGDQLAYFYNTTD